MHMHVIVQVLSNNYMHHSVAHTPLCLSSFFTQSVYSLLLLPLTCGAGAWRGENKLAIGHHPVLLSLLSTIPAAAALPDHCAANETPDARRHQATLMHHTVAFPSISYTAIPKSTYIATSFIDGGPRGA